MKNIPPSAREAYIALNMMDGIGPIGVRNLVSALGSPERIFEASEAELSRAEGVGATLAGKILEQRVKAAFEKEIARAREIGCAILTPADSGYPRRLLKIHDPPLAIYVLGEILPSDDRAVAVVGSRRASIYGRDSAEKMACGLAKAGFCVVSGLARGIDTAAHQGALRSGGRTIAVLGGALDCVYPEENSGLCARISLQGAVLSEFPFGRNPDRTTFPMRNRIISGLSMGVLVVEAGSRSGALITASQALDQGRSVFVVPGRIDMPSFSGSHRLLKEGARLADGTGDILEEFEFLFPPQECAVSGGERAALSPDEEKIVKMLEGDEPDFDIISRSTGIPASRLSGLVLELEMRKIVRMLPGRRLALYRR